jgi:hypothetical protein
MMHHLNLDGLIPQTKHSINVEKLGTCALTPPKVGPSLVLYIVGLIPKRGFNQNCC